MNEAEKYSVIENPRSIGVLSNCIPLPPQDIAHRPVAAAGLELELELASAHEPAGSLGTPEHTRRQHTREPGLSGEGPWHCLVAAALADSVGP